METESLIRVSLKLNASYLTDLPGEAEFLNMLAAENEQSARAAAICALAHEIPMLMDVPYRSLIKMRKDAGPAFDAYRTALEGIVKTYVKKNSTTTQEQAKEIYNDVLRPALSQLESQAHSEHRRWLKRSVMASGVAVGLVSLGLSALAPIPQVVALAGGALVSKLIDQFADAPGDGSVRNNNLYFLLRLQRAAAKSH